jgi:hypothetical protein
MIQKVLLGPYPPQTSSGKAGCIQTIEQGIYLRFENKKTRAFEDNPQTFISGNPQTQGLSFQPCCGGRLALQHEIGILGIKSLKIYDLSILARIMIRSRDRRSFACPTQK